MINFPDPTELEISLRKVDGSYHSQFGFGCAHSGVVYANTNHDLRLGMGRMTKQRVPLLNGFDQYLQQQQRLFIQEHSDFVESLQEQYEWRMLECDTALAECLAHHADPHQKRELRIQGMADSIEHGIVFDDLWYLPKRSTEYKMKIFEIAKVGKVPRVIGNLGIPASLQGFRVTKYIKMAMADEPLEVNGGKIVFCPTPAPAELAQVFNDLIEPPGRFHFVLFSDDSCLSIRVGSKILRFNVDISSCDASHTTDLFMALLAICPEHMREDVEKLIRQCEQEITIFDRNNRQRHVTLKPNRPRLYSGSTLTTIINNLANIFIALAISEADIKCERDVIKAAMRAGYVVTCEDCADWHKLQFLKHSPVYDTTGQIRALMNPGVLLRLSGACKGDVPGDKRTPLRERQTTMQGSLLRGAYPYTHCPLLDNMRRMAGPGNAECDAVIRKSLEYKVIHDDSDEWRVSSEEMWTRYDLTPHEIVELEEGFGKCGYGQHYYSDGTNKVLELDYGLTGKELVERYIDIQEAVLLRNSHSYLTTKPTKAEIKAASATSLVYSEIFEK